MRDLSHSHRFRRCLCAAAVAVAAAAFLGVSSVHAAGFETPSISLAVSPQAVSAGQDVNLTATVSALSGYPAGSVTFATLGSSGNVIANIADAVTGQTVFPLTQDSLSQGHATVQTTFGGGTYAIAAYYTPDPSLPFGSFTGSDTHLTPTILTVSSVLPHTTTTVLSVTPLPVVQNQDETLTATVTTSDDSIPTGEVTFADNGASLGQATLANGVASLKRVGGFGPGSHELSASYIGNAFTRVDANDPLFLPSSSATTSFTLENTVQPTATKTTLAVSQSPINQGDTVDLTAHVTQTGGAFVPPGGLVTFYSSSDCTTDALGTATIDANGNAVLRNVGSWAAHSYTLCASYVGNLFMPTSGTATLDVLPPATATTLTLTGPATGVYGSQASFTAHLIDTSGGVAGKTVTVTLGQQTCSGKTDASGDLACTFTLSDASVSQVSASFAGDLYDAPASAKQPFAVTPAPTALVMSLNGPTGLVGTLTSAGNPAAGVSVHMTLGSYSCDGTTNSLGLATCSIDTIQSGDQTLSGVSAGDGRYQSATDSKTVNVPSTIPTTLTYTGATKGDFNDDVALSALLTSANGPVAGKTVGFTLGTQNCSGTTDSSGVASCHFTITQTAGSVATVSASFAGDGAYLPQSTSSGFTINSEDATLQAHAPASVISGTKFDVTTTLLEDGTNIVSGEPITLTYGDQTCTTTSGSCTFTAKGSGNATITAALASVDRYTATPASATTLVQLATTLTYSGQTTGDYGDSVSFSAYLADQNGHAVASQGVVFTLGSQTCPATTNGSGDATCTLARNDDATAASVTVSFAGSADGVYLATKTSAAYTVTPEETTLTLAPVTSVEQNAPLTLSARLLEDGTTPIAGKTITFTDNGVTCTGTTDSSGVAMCTFASKAIGQTTLAATFAGDTAYETASTATQTIYVYGATGGGMFVVGDKSEAMNGPVVFWGSQWWKQNSLSVGAAPSSFKGYALHGTTTCGGTWSTDPGNSSPPPAGPLPSYIAVIVASSASKSGAAISGTIVHVVVVKTASYDANPGHPGTGSVVANVC